MEPSAFLDAEGFLYPPTSQYAVICQTALDFSARLCYNKSTTSSTEKENWHEPEHRKSPPQARLRPVGQ